MKRRTILTLSAPRAWPDAEMKNRHVEFREQADDVNGEREREREFNIVFSVGERVGGWWYSVREAWRASHMPSFCFLPSSHTFPCLASKCKEKKSYIHFMPYCSAATILTFYTTQDGCGMDVGTEQDSHADGRCCVTCLSFLWHGGLNPVACTMFRGKKNQCFGNVFKRSAVCKFKKKTWDIKQSKL